MTQLLLYSVPVNTLGSKDDKYHIAIKETEAIDLSKTNVDKLRKKIKRPLYKSIQIDDLKSFIEDYWSK